MPFLPIAALLAIGTPRWGASALPALRPEISLVPEPVPKAPDSLDLDLIDPFYPSSWRLFTSSWVAPATE